MQTITTKYIGQTEKRCSRIKVTHSGNYASIIMSYDHALNAEENYIVAAKLLAERLNWDGQFIGGHTKDGMVFVNAKPVYDFTVKSKAPELTTTKSIDEIAEALDDEELGLEDTIDVFKNLMKEPHNVT
jgi:hypothetical protein